ncbi:MAG: hypothetical protein IJW14_04005 [Oscillospiraceae bacterium]|nr:hypothetical protein [Oscillospiraceae bacterium]
MKKGRVNATYDEEYTKSNRTFPVGKTILLVIILLVQIGIIVAACCHQPQPQDIIRRYDVTVQARDDGSLDIRYRFLWEAVDTSEELTWIRIGIANDDYTVYPESVSDNIRYYQKKSEDGEVYLALYLDRAYTGGEVLEFSFEINQQNMLCRGAYDYFFEFIPGWFNSTPVEQYTFRWADDGRIQSVEGGRRQDGYYTWSGSLGCGEYVPMRVHYGQDVYAGCATAPYQAFDDSGTYNELLEDKVGLIVLACVAAALLIIVQVWIIDSVVSYHRGRGFLYGHGYHVHIYGRSNPHYIRARDRYNAEHAGHSGGGFRGGGCACACACACAGGGRAGCSQKDTYSSTEAQ